MTPGLPILWSFRRCPYAMRARLSLHAAGIAVEHREILLRDKPPAMLEASPKGTIPVLVLEDQVIDESLDIMLWALRQHDPEGWLREERDALKLAAACDARFKPHLDRYKYATRYADTDPQEHRAAAAEFVTDLEDRLSHSPALGGAQAGLADYAIFPFIRQYAHTDRDWFAAQNWPSVQAWLDTHLNTVRFAEIMRKHPLWTSDADLQNGV
ncbi:glutathione S-transferase [Maricaulis maris]|uniref:glutathione S-transferase n=1 Tax=Maricaulis maris TaxID=74318 RepID=UPI003B8BE449